MKDTSHVGLCLFTDIWLLALKTFTYLRKSHLGKTDYIAVVNTERPYANRIFQESMDRITDAFEKIEKREPFLF